MQIESVYNTFHADHMIKTCFNTMINEQIGRGIVFRKSGNYTPSDELDRFFNSVMTRFATDLYRSWCMYGFALAVIERDKGFKGVPRILDKRQVHIKIKTFPWNTRAYAVFPMATNGQSDPRQGLLQNKPISGVIVFESPTETPPDKNGNLMSKVYNLIAHRVRFDYLTRIHYQALRLNANPVIFEERKEAKYDAETIQYGNVFGASITQTDKTETLTNNNEPITSQELRLLHRQVDVSRSINSGRSLTTDLTSQSMLNELMQDTNARLIRLPENSTASAPIRADPVNDYEVQRVYYEEIICSTMGIPRRYVNESNYTNSGTVVTDVVYQANQRALKQALLEALYRIYYHVYGEYDEETEEVEDQKMQDIDKINEHKSSSSSSSSSSKSKIQILLPGVPDPEIVDKIFQIGILKLDAYKRYYQKNLDLTEDDFNDDLKMPVPPKGGPETGPDAQNGIGNAKRKPKPKKKETTANKKTKPNPKPGATISLQLNVKKDNKK